MSAPSRWLVKARKIHVCSMFSGWPLIMRKIKRMIRKNWNGGIGKTKNINQKCKNEKQYNYFGWKALKSATRSAAGSVRRRQRGPPRGRIWKKLYANLWPDEQKSHKGSDRLEIFRKFRLISQFLLTSLCRLWYDKYRTRDEVVSWRGVRVVYGASLEN